MWVLELIVGAYCWRVSVGCVVLVYAIDCPCKCAYLCAGECGRMRETVGKSLWGGISTEPRPCVGSTVVPASEKETRVWWCCLFGA